jgi:agmatine deiminase
VRIVTGNEAQRDRLEMQLRHFGLDASRIELFVIPHDDVWARDNGPIFVLDAKGNLAVTRWNFNGWGGRSPSALDAQVAATVASRLNLPLIEAPFVTEGGAMEVDGAGMFMATRSSILNPNRNPDLDQAGVERVFREILGVEHFVWLSGAAPEICEQLGDCTDFHIDLAARFTPGGAVLYCAPPEAADPRHPYLVRHHDELRNATDRRGRPFDLVGLPTPSVYSVSTASIGIQGASEARMQPGRLTDASYTNYLVTNGLVLVPVYGCATDETAKSIIAEQFPGRNVVGIPALTITEEGGAVHCVTQQQPVASCQGASKS